MFVCIQIFHRASILWPGVAAISQSFSRTRRLARPRGVAGRAAAFRRLVDRSTLAEVVAAAPPRAPVAMTGGATPDPEVPADDAGMRATAAAAAAAIDEEKAGDDDKEKAGDDDDEKAGDGGGGVVVAMTGGATPRGSGRRCGHARRGEGGGCRHRHHPLTVSSQMGWPAASRVCVRD